MISIEEYQNRLKKVISELPKEVEKIVISNMDESIDIVREDQIFDKGIGADGRVLGIYRTNRQKTEGWQQSRAYPKLFGDRYNLLDSGNFFNSLIIKKYRGKYQFVIKANVPYFKDILSKTNTTEKQLLGMTPEGIEKLDKTIIKPNLDKWLLKNL